MACDRCHKHSCNGTCSAVNRRGPTGPKGPPGMDGRIQGDGTAGIVPYIVSVNSKNQITALANTNVTYQQLNVLAAGAGGGTRYLSTNNAGVLSWQAVAGGGIGGSGTVDYISKFTPNGTTIGNSLAYEAGGNFFVDAGFNGGLGTQLFVGTAAGGLLTIDGVNVGQVATGPTSAIMQTSIGASAISSVEVNQLDILVLSPNITDETYAYFQTDGMGRFTLRSGASPSGITLSTPLTGLSITGGAITSSSTILDAFGALQNQINGISGGGITSLNGLTGAVQTFTNDTNVTIVSGGTAHVVTWAGTLADGRIASAATWNSKESALTFSTGLTRVVDTITIDSTVVTLTGAQALTNKTYNGNTWTAGSNTLTLAGNFITTGAFNTTFAQQATATITLPSATSTLLANNLGITGGSTWISGTAVGDKAIIQATSNATHTAAKDLITLRKNSAAAAATSVLMTIGDGQGVNNDEVSIYTGVNTGTSGYLLRAGATFAYFNASSSLRLQIAAADIIQLSSSTATMVQGITISDAKNIVLNTTTGTKIGTATSQKLGFWAVTPIVQPSGANQAALTDSTTGTAAFTLVDVGALFNQANINNNFASVARLLNEIRTNVLVAEGLMKGSA